MKLRYVRRSAQLLLIACVTLNGQGPIPEFYGIYALNNGKLVELFQNPDLNNYEPSVRFVAFLKGSGQPVDKIFFIPPSQPQTAANRQMNGWDDFWKQTQTPGGAMEKAMLYGVPSNAVEVAFQIGPYGSNREMVQIVPRQSLPPRLLSVVQGSSLLGAQRRSRKALRAASRRRFGVASACRPTACAFEPPYGEERRN